MDVKKEPVPPKKNAAKKRKADDDLEKDNTKYQKRAWTNEEEAIFLELVKKAVTDNMWALAKADGRLVHRGSDGIKAHVKALIRKMS
ncbi:hypothetical protein HD553DRAFT_345679 [Filobasidium floriforme]|uniref:uncharacterized protein n=1 Tax=Filobasidium floriforme TaxID=5210 RepID=UPI001E8E1816|nr:uncharacterized protein HD553DRAFT_345679 [Filobasidium floriforme]KAH8079339.1 hypothetical protein HD553DRAFT_345679 [Filobasidium floriforme]